MLGPALGVKGWVRCFLHLYLQQRPATCWAAMTGRHLDLFFNVIRSLNWAHPRLGGTEAEKQFISGQFGQFLENWLLLGCTGWPMSDLRNYRATWYFARLRNSQMQNSFDMLICHKLRACPCLKSPTGMDQPPQLTDGDTEAWRVKAVSRVGAWIIRQPFTSVSITGHFPASLLPQIEWSQLPRQPQNLTQIRK